MELTLPFIIFTSLVGLFVAGFLYVSRLFVSKSPQIEDEDCPGESKPVKNNVNAQKPTRKAEKSSKHHGSGKEKAQYNHPWLKVSLKGHSGRVTSVDLSGNGKFLASSSEDRSLILWPTNFANKKSHRGNVAFDYGSHIKWSPDSKAIIVHKAQSRAIDVYKVAKKAQDSYSIAQGFEFEVAHAANDDVIGMDIDSGGKYIMTCAANSNEIIIYDLKGTVLTRIDTFRMTTSFANISPCGKYVAAAGFTPDVKVWSVKFSKSKEFEKIQRAFELTGHTSGIYHFAWRSDSTRVATVSKDGTWRVYNVDVDHHMGQEPKLVAAGPVSAEPSSRVAISPDGRVLAVSVNKAVSVFSVDTGERVVELADVHTEPLTGLMFDAEGQWFVTSGDKHLRVFYNVVGYKLSLKDLKKKLSEASSKAWQERLEQQIEDLSRRLADIGQSN